MAQRESTEREHRSRRRVYRLVFFTLPATVLMLWLAAGAYTHNQVREHHEAATRVAQALALASNLYAQEHNGSLPQADHWEEALRPYLGNVPLTLPRTSGARGRRFAMNRAVAGRKLDIIAEPAAAILFYESTANAPDTADDFSTLPPTDDADNLIVVYVDGHMYDYPQGSAGALIQRSREAQQAITK